MEYGGERERGARRERPKWLRERDRRARLKKLRLERLGQHELKMQTRRAA